MFGLGQSTSPLYLRWRVTSTTFSQHQYILFGVSRCLINTRSTYLLWIEESVRDLRSRYYNSGLNSRSSSSRIRVYTYVRESIPRSSRLGTWSNERWHSVGKINILYQLKSVDAQLPSPRTKVKLDRDWEKSDSTVRHKDVHFVRIFPTLKGFLE